MSKRKSTSTKTKKKGKKKMNKELLNAELSKQIDAFHAKRKNLQNETKTLADDVVAALQTIINAAPGVVAIRWHQYVPGFNDGDACEFTVGDLEVKFNEDLAKEYKNEEVGTGEDEDEEDDGRDGFVDTYDLKEFIKKNMDVLNHDQIGMLEYQYEAIEKLWNALSCMESELETRFGSGTQITVTKDGIETEDYDCGY